METWFLFAIASTIFSGIHIFIQKIGALRGYNSSLLNGYSAGLAAFVGFIAAWIIEGLGELSFLLLGFAVVSGGIHIIGTNMRMDAFKFVEATVFLPLHKFISPLIALVLGIVFFSETLTTSELIGVMFGVFVPLLLISRAENKRQHDLSRGLMLMLVSATLAAIASAINKEVTNIFASVLLFAALANTCAALAGAALYRYRKQDSNTTGVHFKDPKLLGLSFVSGVIQAISFGTFMLAFEYGGPLAIVYTIHSLYILIPIVLAIILYKEHWNLRKVFAIVLSLGAIALMG